MKQRNRIMSIMLTLLMLLSFAALGEDVKDYTTGTPWPDTDLEGVVTPDTPAVLKDNFALYVNKDRLLELEIPEGYPYAGTIMDVVLKNAEDVRNMFLGDVPETHDAKLAYDLFGLLMDWDARNAAGVAPLKAQVEAVEAIDSLDAMNAWLIETPVEDLLGILWSYGSDISLDDALKKDLLIGECGLLLGDSAEYETLTDYGAIKKAAFLDLAGKMLGKLGYSEDEVQAKIDNSFAWEAKLAPVIFTNEERGSADYMTRIRNYMSRDELAEAQGKVPMLEAFDALGYPRQERYWIMNPAFIETLSAEYTEENLPLMRDFLIVRGAISQAGELDRECYEWSNDCSNAISGATGMLPDETVFSRTVASMLAWPVARLYTETYLKEEDKIRVAELVDRTLDAYHGILSEADFLSDATKAKAIEKLEAITPMILYPDSWEKYECPELNFAGAAEGGALNDALRAIARYNIEENVREFTEPVDREKWTETPQTVNCSYNPQVNAITIMGAFAQGNMYNSAMSDEELYATLGAVIGHEISHAFDRDGAQFDKDGNMANWWTEEDYAAFQARNEKMIAYYNAMHPWEGQDFYGSIMTGEACADMAGVKVMLRLAAEKEDFDYDAFFRAHAELWLTKDTLQRAYSRINDVHPMSYLRVNATLQQFDEFLNCYGITEGDGMYLAPEDRVNIW